MDLREVKKPTFYTIKEVSSFMGIKPLTLYKMIKEGKIKAINIACTGKKRPIYGILPEEVQRFYDRLQERQTISGNN